MLHIKFDKKKFVMDMILIAIGATSYACAMTFFLTPAKIAPGGMSGLGIIINSLTGLRTGTVILLLNIPLVVMALRVLGKRFLFKTFCCVVLSSLMIDLGGYLPTFDVGEPLLAALYGGLLMGFGLGLVCSRGGSNGGSDIISRLIYRKRPYLSIGRIVLIVDLSIIALSAIVFRDITTALYGLVALFVSSTIIDQLIQGFNSAKLTYIISNKAHEITHVISEDIHRGATLLEGQGGYSKCHTNVIMCVARPHELPHLKNLIKATDPDAFVIVTGAHEVMGSSFRPTSIT